MPELPEIHVFARDMQKELVGRTISGIEVVQPKCLNLPEQEFQAALTGAQILNVTPHGKWLQVETNQGWLLLNLGMGGEILLTSRDGLPEKYRLVLDLADRAALAINFWWLMDWQHQRMGEHAWIYYALSNMRHFREHRNALHLLQLTESGFPYRSFLYLSDLGNQPGKILYARWGGFVQGLFRCDFGWQLQRLEDVHVTLRLAQELQEALIDLYFVAPKVRACVRVTPFLTDVGGDEPFEIGIDQPER